MRASPKNLIREEKAESIVYYGSDYGIQAKYKVPYKKEDKKISKHSVGIIN